MKTMDKKLFERGISFVHACGLEFESEGARNLHEKLTLLIMMDTIEFPSLRP